MERALASIRRIAEINPIEGADRISVATVDGWQVVIANDVGHKVDDLIIYYEIDSLLPELPEYEFLRKNCYVKEGNSVNGPGFRLKTIKLRKQISQGLIMPVFDNYDNDDTAAIKGVSGGTIIVHEGDDVTEFLGVKKYEKPVPATWGGKVKGNFPSFIPKTDAERIQNRFRSFENYWNDHTFEATIKLDGTSFTAYYRKHPDLIEGAFGVCSRNLDLEEAEGNLYWSIARKYGIEEKLRSLPFSAAIQGEIMGPGIQGNKEGLTEHTLFVFNIYNIDEGRYLDPTERWQILLDIWDEKIPEAPFMQMVHGSEFGSVVDFLAYAEGPSLFAKEREGVVFKSLTDPTIQFKAISNKWLLSNGE